MININFPLARKEILSRIILESLNLSKNNINFDSIIDIINFKLVSFFLLISFETLLLKN